MSTNSDIKQHENEEQMVLSENKINVSPSSLIVEEQSTVFLDNTVSFTKEKFEELNSQILSLMEKNEKQHWICKVCGKDSGIKRNRKQDMMNHIEGKHLEGVSHSCSQCEQKFRSRNCLSSHTSRVHKNRMPV